MTSICILDTSALLCFLRDEKGAEIIQNLLTSRDHELKMHKVNLGELYYSVLKKDGVERADQLYGMLFRYPIHFVEDLSDAFIMTAGRLKVKYSLGFADSFAAATAMVEKATLVTKDNDFRPLEKDGILPILWV